MKPFNILMLGDVVGQNALTYLEKKLWSLRRELDVSFAVVNGENVAVGNGIDPESARSLFHAGADVITTGNHVFRRKEVKSYLDDEPRLLRPANYPPACYGGGSYVADADGISYIQHEGTYAGTVTKGDATLDVVNITKIAEIVNVVLPFVVPAQASGIKEN